jgi:hypothetical protein
MGEIFISNYYLIGAVKRAKKTIFTLDLDLLINVNNLRMKSGDKICLLLLICSFSFFSSPSWAQLSASDSVFYSNAINNSKVIYFQSLGDQSGLYNGSQYPGYAFGFKDGGHPFFYTDVILKGSIVYDKLLYPKAGLLYDEVMEVVLFQGATFRIQLISEKISHFSVLGNNFIRVVKDSSNRTLVSTGFYQLLYEGKITVLKKEVKSIREVLISNAEGIYRYIDIKKYFYIRKNNEYYLVKSKKTIFKLFKEQKREMQQYIKQNRLNFKKDPDSLVVKLSAYYDQLTR